MQNPENHQKGQESQAYKVFSFLLQCSRSNPIFTVVNFEEHKMNMSENTNELLTISFCVKRDCVDACPVCFPSDRRRLNIEMLMTRHIIILLECYKSLIEVQMSISNKGPIAFIFHSFMQ